MNDATKNFPSFPNIQITNVTPTKPISGANPSIGGEFKHSPQSIAWLIELNLIPNRGRAEWFVGGPTNSVEFSSDPNKAVRFCRRQDAQAVLDWLRVNEKLLVSAPNADVFYSVTEHIWVDFAEN